MKDIETMKVTELKAQLKKLGLKTAGRKAELLQRLAEALESKNAAGEAHDEPSAAAAPAAEEAEVRTNADSYCCL